MNLFESNNNETRQQRLALTWSGKNENAADDIGATCSEEDLKRPVTTSQSLTEEELDFIQASSELGLGDLLEEAEPVRPTIKLTKALPIVEDVEPEVEDVIEEVTARPTLTLTKAAPVVHDLTVAEFEPSLDDDAEFPVEPEPVRPTLTLTKPPSAVIEEPVPVVEVTENVEDAVQVHAADEFGEETPTVLMDPVEVMNEGATHTLPVMNPVEVNDEFKLEPDELIAEEDSKDMDHPKKITLTKAAVIPEPDEEMDVARPALTVTKDDDKTCTLKPRRVPAKHNTCRLKPDTSEIVAETLGGKLRAARELAGLSEFELAEKTRISSEYISSLENEAFDDLPLAPIYIKSYLKTLARQFGLDADELIVEYDEKTGVTNEKKPITLNAAPKEEAAAKESGSSSKWLNRSIASVAAALALLMIVGVLYKTLGGGNVTTEELQVITNKELCDSIRTTYLPARHMPIPGHESAAMNDY